MCKYRPPHSVCCSPLFFQLSPLLVFVTMALLFVFLPLCYFWGSFISSSAHLLNVDISLDILGSSILTLYILPAWLLLCFPLLLPTELQYNFCWKSLDCPIHSLKSIYPKRICLFSTPNLLLLFLFTISMSSTTVHLLI